MAENGSSVTTLSLEAYKPLTWAFALTILLNS
jgi:hypothetical protein